MRSSNRSWQDRNSNIACIGKNENTRKQNTYTGTNKASCKSALQNFFGINASQPLSYWIKKGWIYHEDPRGWFQWYCRYYMGRRCLDDQRQINRWKAMQRHVAQVRKNCRKADYSSRPRQRQALFHWAYDSRKI